MIHMPGWVGDAFQRWRTRRALGRRLDAMRPHPTQDPGDRRTAELTSVLSAPEVPPAAARLRRTELPLDFWRHVLGKRLSFASGFWPRWAKDIDRAETEWLQLVADRAGLADGQRVLELGASQGAVARWAKDEHPGLDVTVMALDQASQGVPSEQQFDRILVLEALAGLANPAPLLRRLRSRLEPGGLLFLQTVCHWRTSYFFLPGDEHRWLFDTPDGALMPGEELLASLGDELEVVDRWELSGEHYERTARAWRGRLEENAADLRRILADSGDARPAATFRAWRNALLAQETMFGYREGQEWALTQLLIEAATPSSGPAL